jgi:hypothetical protein
MMIYHWRMIRVLLLSDDCGIDSVPNSYVKSVYTICNVVQIMMSDAIGFLQGYVALCLN